MVDLRDGRGSLLPIPDSLSVKLAGPHQAQLFFLENINSET